MTARSGREQNPCEEIPRTTATEVTEQLLAPVAASLCEAHHATTLAARSMRRPQGDGYSASLDEQLPSPAPRVAVFRKIDFCRASFRIEHRADLFDEHESNITDLLFAQPAGNRAALQRDG